MFRITSIFILLSLLVFPAKVLKVKGSARVRQKSGKVVKCSTSTRIATGDMVMTGSAGQVQIGLVDNSVVTVYPNSKYTITAETDGKGNDSSKSMLVKGKANFDLSKLSKLKKGQGSYKMYSPTSVVGIRGTVFDAMVGGDGETSLSVKKGAVAASSDAVGEDDTVSDGTVIGKKQGYKAGIDGKVNKTGKLKLKEPKQGYPSKVSDDAAAHYLKLMADLADKINKMADQYEAELAEIMKINDEAKALMADGDEAAAKVKAEEAQKKNLYKFITYKNTMARIYQYHGYQELLASNNIENESDHIVETVFEKLKKK